eukprot:gene11140-24484_t
MHASAPVAPAPPSGGKGFGTATWVGPVGDECGPNAHLRSFKGGKAHKGSPIADARGMIPSAFVNAREATIRLERLANEADLTLLDSWNVSLAAVRDALSPRLEALADRIGDVPMTHLAGWSATDFVKEAANAAAESMIYEFERGAVSVLRAHANVRGAPSAAYAMAIGAPHLAPHGPPALGPQEPAADAEEADNPGDAPQYDEHDQDDEHREGTDGFFWEGDQQMIE